MEYGCIGNPLGPSYSEEIHHLIGGYRYELKQLREDELREFFRAADFKGINVTIPYKQAVIPFLDGISDRAERIGAVNTIVNRDGKLYGDNTDYLGLTALLSREHITLKEKKILILGTGGTAKTAHAVAEDLGAREIVRVSRTGKDGALTYADAAALHADAEVILNATPCGMYPEIKPSPIGLSLFPRLESVIDVIYNPLRTTLLQEAGKRGLKTAGGLFMLVSQAVAAASLFFPDRPSADAEAIYRTLLRKKENLVLIGMPTCGKTSVGQIAAFLSERKCFDTDVLFRKKHVLSPAQYIEAYGEPAFRDAEAEIVAELSKVNSSVIAVGGGTVLREENVAALKKNGILVWLERPLDELRPAANRPLSNDKEKLEALWYTRRPIYQSVADVTVDAAGPISVAIADLIEKDLI